MGTFGPSFREMPPVTKNLIILNVIVWLAMMISPTINNNMMQYCALHFYKASDFNLIQPVTYLFMHSTQGIWHILFNMFTLYMFGCLLERVMGSKRFLLFYMVCGIGAALIQELVWDLTWKNILVDVMKATHGGSAAEWREGPEAAVSQGIRMPALNQIFLTIGASGAIYGVLLAFAMLFPNMPLYFMFIPVPVKAKWMVLIWVGLELLLGMSEANDGVAHFAHLGGMLFGFALLYYWKKKGTLHGGYY